MSLEQLFLHSTYSYMRILYVLLLFWSITVFAQKKNDHLNYRIAKATGPITIDGKADEDAWLSPEVGGDYDQVLPMDTSKAVTRTEFKLTYDDKNLYLLVINYNSTPGPYVIESMRRDFGFYDNDNNLFMLDPYNDQTNGFSFGSSVAGGQWDGLISQGRRLDLSWEAKWSSETTYDEEKWIWEAAIPFKTLRYSSEKLVWGMNFSRIDLKTSEKSAWGRMPRQFPTISLPYAGNLIWDTPPPAPGANISLIPYVTGGLQKDHERGTPTVSNGDIGLDAKIGLTSALNLDLTVNPDFSQVEVDVQQTNLDRFELFFPERRQFFLENGDLFNNFGFNGLRPFFSRRVGLNAPLFYGARLSGKVSDGLRIGVLNTQTGRNPNGLQGSNFSVASFQQQVFARSNVAGIFVNRETSGEYQEGAPLLKDYNRTLGLEYNLLSADQQWTGKFFYLKTLSPGLTAGADNNIFAVSMERDTRTINWQISAERVGDKVVGNEVGFIRRLDYLRINPEASYAFFPEQGKSSIVSHGPRVGMEQFFTRNELDPFENETFLAYEFLWLDRSQLRLFSSYNFQRLQRAFDPTNLVGDTLATGSEHSWRAYGFEYTSTNQKRLTYELNFRNGGYYASGMRTFTGLTLGYRFQPYVSMELNADYNNIRFKEDADLPLSMVNQAYDIWLLGPRLNVTFSNKLFLSNFFQYNSQSNQVNLNTRFQWRYSPASDLFIVYTDNYLAENFLVRNRAIVLKFTYWWNV